MRPTLLNLDIIKTAVVNMAPNIDGKSTTRGRGRGSGGERGRGLGAAHHDRGVERISAVPLAAV